MVMNLIWCPKKGVGYTHLVALNLAWYNSKCTHSQSSADTRLSTQCIFHPGWQAVPKWEAQFLVQHPLAPVLYLMGQTQAMYWTVCARAVCVCVSEWVHACEHVCVCVRAWVCVCACHCQCWCLNMLVCLIAHCVCVCMWLWESKTAQG